MDERVSARHGPGLTDRREWVCELPDGTARMPCGGTHVGSLADLDGVRVALALDESGQQLTMRTTVGTSPHPL